MIFNQLKKSIASSHVYINDKVSFLFSNEHLKKSSKNF